MTTDVNKVLLRVRNLKEFKIQSAIPESFTLSGTVPYDMKISNGVGTFTVYAEDLTEADVIAWVKETLGAEQVEATENAIAAQIAAAKSPASATGTPWA